jgi:hypothetical protein
MFDIPVASRVATETGGEEEGAVDAYLYAFLISSWVAVGLIFSWS